MGCCALDPWVLQRLFGGEAFRRVLLQEFPDQVVAVRRYRLPVWMFKRYGRASRGSCVGERVVAATQDKSDHAAREVVATVAVKPGHHLGRHVLLRAHPLAARVAEVGEVPSATEIDDAQVARPQIARFRAQQEVLGLQIPMADLLVVHVVDAKQDLLHDGCDLLLAEARDLVQGIIQVAAGAVIHHQININMVFEQVVHTDDVRMLQLG
mmetsp:Transcript_91712/g.264515  ORF Transcript_91712/g.264515 Transcript_91712/m.264515 type:complete len:210 (-) Transcript_91712:423-1052(-)